MRRFGWIGVVLVMLLTLVAGGIGYTIGSMQTAAVAVDPGGAGVTYVVPAGWHGWGVGFPFFGLLFVFVLFLIVVGLIRRAAWGGRGGWAGPGGWAGHAHPDARPGWYGPGRWGYHGPWAEPGTDPNGGSEAGGPQPGAPGGGSGAGGPQPGAPGGGSEAGVPQPGAPGGGLVPPAAPLGGTGPAS